VEEFNRTLEDTLNALAMAYRQIAIPRGGLLVARRVFV
jgi:hypothetical protein